MESLEERLSYKFKNSELLQQALTHTTFPAPSSSPFNSGKRTCDHLKLLGDSVIKLLTSQYAICVSLPNEKVHNIVRIKDNLSNRYCQNLIGQSLKLGEDGILVTNLPRDQIVSHLDTFVKSLFGAIFLDAGGSQKKGFISCWKVFLKLWKPVIAKYDGAKPLLSCFPEPKYSSQEFLKERFSNFKLIDLKLVEEKIGFQFLKHPHLLEASMTHDSIDMFRNVADSPDPNSPEFVHFQTLEFLGDSVLELVIMEYLYLRSSSADPLGQMLFFSRDTSSKLVSSRFQIQVAKKLKLENFVIKPPNVGLASYDDFVESLIGAIFIHAKAIGLRACAKIVLEMWGLEPCLEAQVEEKGEVKKETVPEDTSVGSGKKNAEKRRDSVSAPAMPSTSAAGYVPPPRPALRKTSSHEELQTILDYKFVNASLLNYFPARIDVSTAETRVTSLNLINVSKNLQTIGKRAISLTIAEYVTGICHSSKTADLSAKTKQTAIRLMESLSSDELLAEIFARFQMSKYFNLDEKKLPNPTTSPSDVINLIFGAVYIDSSGNPLKVQKLFLKLWQSYTNGAKPETSLITCFPDTSEKQKIFRAAVNAQISETMWKKISVLLGHTFSHKNLLEQALTDEKSQGYAKQCHNAYPLGNPFGLQIIGKSAVDLFIAQRCYVNTLSEPGNFTAVLHRFDQSLFNVLKTRFHNLERYYANQFRYPFPPKKNPRAPYEAMLAALYLDVGGGMKGMQQIYVAIEKACPTLLDMKKAKAIKQEPADAEGGSCSPVSADGKDGSGEELYPRYSESTNSSSSSPMMSSRSVPEENHGSPENAVKSATGGNVSQPLILSPPALIVQEPILSELQAKLGYNFVNPLLLKIALEVDIPIGLRDNNPHASSKSHFEIFQILGKRAVNLLATEAVLTSLSISKNADLSGPQRMQLQNQRAHLAGRHVMGMIAESLELKKYIFTSGDKNDAALSNEGFLAALLGAVFIDSRANYLKISAVFKKLWKSNGIPNLSQSLVQRCFPETIEGQIKLRNGTATSVNDSNWKKFYKKLGYTFKNRNLLEQALTDEYSQELAKTKFNAYPTGNPFALRLLGAAAMQLVIAYKTLPASLTAAVTNYVDGLSLIEKAMINSFKNNFLGTEKYYACIKLTKNQKFPPVSNPAGPYEAVMGAVYIDSGGGNPGLDTVGMVIIHRSIGIKGSKPNIAIFDAIPVIPSTPGSSNDANTSVDDDIIQGAVPVSCSTPTPSTSSALSESLNTSFSSKCAANFSFSPAQVKTKTPPKPVTPAVVDTAAPSVSTQKTPLSSPLPKSPVKAQKEQQKSYASALVNGKQLQTNNKLIIAVTNATSQIQALKKEQETIDHCRKLSMEKEEKLQKSQVKDLDQISNASSSRSRCPSTSASTAASIASQQQQTESGQKRKRGGRGGKKQNKKTKPAAVPQQTPPQVAVTPQQIYAQRVSAWCQNQLDQRPSSSSTEMAGASSSCTNNEVYQQRSMVHQEEQEIRQEMEEPNLLSSQFSSPTHSTYNTHVPVNMVSGYRKSAVVNDGHDTFNCGHSHSFKKEVPTGQSTTGNSDATDPPSSGFSYYGVLKWTSLILGVAFLLKRYSQGK